MFKSLRRLFCRNKQQESQSNKTFLYLIGEKERLCVFFSDIEMKEAQLTTAVDIIYDNASKEVDGNRTAQQVLKECFPTLSGGAIHIESYDEGKCWEIRISKDPLAFR